MVSRCLEEKKAAAADKVGKLMSRSLFACPFALKTHSNCWNFYALDWLL